MRGTFSTARFIGFWFMFIWRQYWTPQEVQVLLVNNAIPFADRTDAVSALQVFRDLFIAEWIFEQQLGDSLGINPDRPIFRNFPPGDPKQDPILAVFYDAIDIFHNPSRSAEKQDYLDKARIAFQNSYPFLPDGGAMYGINLHRRRKGVHQLGADVW